LLAQGFISGLFFHVWQYYKPLWRGL